MLLTIQNLEVRYGTDVALSITEPIVIQEGDRVGVIGSNGAGKTTLVKSLLGIVPYRGSIQTELKPEQMAVHMQFNEYTDAMQVRHVMEAILDTKIARNRKLQELIRFFEFEDCLRKKYTKLSGGQKQRFTIILVMMQESALTFYDEVTSGLDFETRQKLVEKLTEWYKGKKDSFLMVSHYYEELDQLADKLLILDKGRVLCYGDKEELFHRYCGRAVVVVGNTDWNRRLLAGYNKLAAPSHLLALSCDSEEREREITGLLLRNNVNYKRSNNDIEILYINARAAAGVTEPEGLEASPGAEEDVHGQRKDHEGPGGQRRTEAYAKLEGCPGAEKEGQGQTEEALGAGRGNGHVK